MTHILVTINDVVEFDGDPGAWVNRPPDLFKDMIRPGAKPQPWMMAIMQAVLSAVTDNRDMRCTVEHEPGRWSVEVAEK